mmetsp:Transcript_31273/g.67206  ORF Transcript_31273/g.67206 Transcript_31273/m.67206 type:complete len:307 (+) Transcript_31273:532-1452(+)
MLLCIHAYSGCRLHRVCTHVRAECTSRLLTLRHTEKCRQTQHPLHYYTPLYIGNPFCGLRRPHIRIPHLALLPRHPGSPSLDLWLFMRRSCSHALLLTSSAHRSLLFPLHERSMLSQSLRLPVHLHHLGHHKPPREVYIHPLHTLALIPRAHRQILPSKPPSQVIHSRLDQSVKGGQFPTALSWGTPHLLANLIPWVMLIIGWQHVFAMLNAIRARSFCIAFSLLLFQSKTLAHFLQYSVLSYARAREHFEIYSSSRFRIRFASNLLHVLHSYIRPFTHIPCILTLLIIVVSATNTDEHSSRPPTL